MPDGIPFMGVFVELFEGATLPLESDVFSKEFDYADYLDNQISNQEIKNQIAVLESQITNRRRDEAILGTDNGWLVNKRNEISVLRSQLK